MLDHVCDSYFVKYVGVYLVCSLPQCFKVGCKFASQITENNYSMLKLHSTTFNAFSENTYIIYNEEGLCWIIDPGMYDAEETNSFTRFIDQHGLKPQAVINTHAHIDHIFGVQAMIDKYQIPFFLHPLEGPVLQGAKGAAMMFGFQIASIPQPTDALKEGSKLQLGADTVEVRFAPGHSPGHVVFYYAVGGWVIGGDVLFSGSIGRTDLPGGHHATLINSIRAQLFTLPDSTVVHPGHGPATTVGEERRSNPFLQG
jgi:glyoxylase-like metal-dependent hydrolase (beta-lactamase superfamily II)